MNHKIDINDKQYIEERFGKVLGWVPGAMKNGVINPQVTVALLESGAFASVFHVKPVYYETPSGHWRPLSEVTLHHGNHKIEFTKDWWKVHPRYLSWLDKRTKLIGGQLLIPSVINAIPSPYSGVVRSLHESLVPIKLGLTTTTFYPDPSPETTTVDGNIDTFGLGSTWDIAHDLTSATGRAFDSSTTGNAGVSGKISGANFFIARGFYLFNTASIPDTDTISSATFSSKSTENGANGDNDADDWITVVQSSPASNTALIADDFDQCGAINNPTEGIDTGTRFNVASLTTNTYADFALNATGIGWISKTGVTKLGMREGHDVIDSAYAGANDTKNGASHYFADEAGTGSDPKLVVIHVASSTFIPRVTFIM